MEDLKVMGSNPYCLVKEIYIISYLICVSLSSYD